MELLRERTIGEIIRCILSHVKLPKSFWGEAVRTAVDLINKRGNPITNRKEKRDSTESATQIEMNGRCLC